MMWWLVGCWAYSASPLDEASAILANDGPVERADLVTIRDALVGTSADPPDWARSEFIDRLHQATRHADPRVRRIGVEGFGPLAAPTPLDRGYGAPTPALAVGQLEVFLQDPDAGVRRRALQLVRNAPDAWDRGVLRSLYIARFDDPDPSVRALAMRTLPDAVTRGILAPNDAWQTALDRIRQPMPAGRAACNQLARLEPYVRGSVDPVAAMEGCLKHHPERAWAIGTAWRNVLPARPEWMRTLLTQTLGLSPDLIRRWAEQDPDALREILRRWSPSRRPERKDMVLRLLSIDDDSMSGSPSPRRPE